MNIYCKSCGYRCNYSNKRPKFCESCGEPFDSAPAPKRHETHNSKAKQVIEELDPIQEEGFDESSIRSSILLHKEENDNKFMTVEQLRNSQVSFARGQGPVESDIREQVIGEMLGQRSPSSAPNLPTEGQGGARKVSRLTR